MDMKNIKARPIIMGGWSVNRILADEKTQTRRPIKPQPDMMDDSRRYQSVLSDGMAKYGKPGDLLWVRETWRTAGTLDRYPPKMSGPKSPYQYKADMATVRSDQMSKYAVWGKWRPSIFMPRWASRVTLRVKDIRVERVQEISPQDCECEGITGKTLASPMRGQPYEIYSNQDGLDYTTPIEAFRALWNSIYAKPKLKKTRTTMYYESYPWSEADRDPRETINGKPHNCYPNPLNWVVSFVREERT